MSNPDETPTVIRAATTVARFVSVALLGGCTPASAAAPTDPSLAVSGGAGAARAASTTPPQERAVIAAMAAYKQAITAGDVAALDRIWAADYTFINPQGTLVTRSQRLANFGSGNTSVDVIDNEREITVTVVGDMALVQNLSTLHAVFSGRPTDTDLRGTFVWIRRGGRWQLLTNQLTAVAP